MAEGLRPHEHQYYTDHQVRTYDKEKNRDEVIDVMRCMICGHQDYIYSFEPHEDNEEELTFSLSEDYER